MLLFSKVKFSVANLKNLAILFIVYRLLLFRLLLKIIVELEIYQS